MPETMKAKHHPMPPVPESSFFSLLSGWVQQGVENFFATQRILVDLAVRQNTTAMQIVRERLSDPEYCPMAIVTDFAGEAMTNFIHGQKLLLELAQQESELVLNGVKDRVGGYAVATAMTDLVRRGLGTFIEMQQEFLKNASKQSQAWLAAVEKGGGYDGEHLIEFAREAMDTFVHTQKKFLDVIARETAVATGGKEEPMHKGRVVEISELARQATEAFIEAQKKLMDVAEKQMGANMKATGRALNMLKPFPFIPIPDLTREGVKSFVNAEKALIDTMIKRRGVEPKTRTAPKPRAKKRTARARKPVPVTA